MGQARASPSQPRWHVLGCGLGSGRVPTPCPHSARGSGDRVTGGYWGGGHGLWVALAVPEPCPPPHRDPRAAPEGPHAGGGDGRAVHLSGPPRLSPPGAWGGRGLLFPSRQSLTSPCDAAGAAGPGAASCAGGRRGAHGHLRDNEDHGDPRGFTPRAAGDGDSTCEVCPYPPQTFPLSLHHPQIIFLSSASPSDPPLVPSAVPRPAEPPTSRLGAVGSR